MRKIILASQSPRRLEILKNHGINPIVMPANVNEIIEPSLKMEDMVMSLALQKASACLCSIDKAIDGLIIGSDTIVYKNEILGKPKDRADAKRMLNIINGSSHYVCTGVAIIDIQTRKEILLYDTTVVKCRRYTNKQIEEYLDTDEPYDKAGSYAIQGIFGKYIDCIEGDYENVVGLPWHLIKEHLDL